VRSRPSREPRRTSAWQAKDEALVRALASGDERLFAELVDAWSPAILALALARLRDRAAAEDAVQQTWLEVLRGLARFEGRSSLRTWVLGIGVNVARAHARADRRSVPLDELGPVVGDGGVLPRTRFEPADHPRAPHHWAIGPTPWPSPEEALLTEEARRVILDAIAGLPASQREVITLRDIVGCSAEEACEALGLSAGNQRVLLHRARSRVRLDLEGYFEATEPT
jgi:RNA polymerase sigma-70 factor, ECF subfamily